MKERQKKQKERKVESNQEVEKDDNREVTQKENTQM